MVDGPAHRRGRTVAGDGSGIAALGVRELRGGRQRGAHGQQRGVGPGLAGGGVRSRLAARVATGRHRSRARVLRSGGSHQLPHLRHSRHICGAGHHLSTGADEHRREPSDHHAPQRRGQVACGDSVRGRDCRPTQGAAGRVWQQGSECAEPQAAAEPARHHAHLPGRHGHLGRGRPRAGHVHDGSERLSRTAARARWRDRGWLPAPRAESHRPDRAAVHSTRWHRTRALRALHAQRRRHRDRARQQRAGRTMAVHGGHHRHHPGSVLRHRRPAPARRDAAGHDSRNHLLQAA